MVSSENTIVPASSVKQLSGRYAGFGGTASGRTKVKLSMAVACLAPFGIAFLSARPALAQMTASCAQKLNFGKFAIAGGAASLTVTPGGSVPPHPSVVTVIVPQAGQCKVSGFTGTTGSLKIQVSLASATMNNGVDVMTVKKFNIDTKNAGRTKIYFSVSLTKTSMPYDIGARLSMDGGDSVGSYSGSVVIIHTYTN